MSLDLVVENTLNAEVQPVQDQSENTSALYLGTGNVGVGSGTNIVRRLDVIGNNDVTGALAAASSSGSQRVNIWVDETADVGRLDSGNAGQRTLRINDGGGEVSIGGNLNAAGSDVRLSGLANLPAAGTVDLVVDSQGNVTTQTSSRRFKEKIRRLQDDFSKVLSLEAVSYVDRATGAERIGFTAEDVHEKELGSLVAYDDDGKPLSVHYKLVPVYLTEVVKRQQALVEQLKDRLAEFEQRMGCLEGAAG